MKIASFAGIVLTVLFAVVALSYIEKISDARDVHNEALFSAETDNGAVVSGYVGAYTRNIGIFSILHFGFYLVLSAIAFYRYRNRIFLFSGVICSLGMLVWTVWMMNNPMQISFDEVGPVWIVMCLTQMAVSISLIRVSFHTKFSVTRLRSSVAEN